MKKLVEKNSQNSFLNTYLYTKKLRGTERKHKGINAAADIILVLNTVEYNTQLPSLLHYNLFCSCLQIPDLILPAQAFKQKNAD